jgi:streptomycin 6-kinase
VSCSRPGPGGPRARAESWLATPEAEQEADALRLWDGDGAVRCLAEGTFENTIALLLERCMPGTPLKSALPEPDQDVVLAAPLRGGSRRVRKRYLQPSEPAPADLSHPGRAQRVRPIGRARR